MTSTNFILQIFAEASGLITNLQNTNYYPIRCSDTELQLLTSEGRNISTFPYTYLGLPLHFKKPNHATLQPLVQKISNFSLTLVGNFLLNMSRVQCPLISSVSSKCPNGLLVV
jgi:hypothetical protein